MPDDSEEPIDLTFDTEGLPEFYTDGYRFAAGPYTINLIFTVSTGIGRSRNVVNVQMSPGHAKVMAILFQRNVKSFEEQFGTEIPISKAILDQHNIDLSTDWHDRGAE